MTHGKTILGTVAALGLAVAIACGEPGGDASMSCWGAFCYAPSNVDPDVLDGTLSDLIFEGSACESAARIDTDDCRVDCADGARCA